MDSYLVFRGVTALAVMLSLVYYSRNDTVCSFPLISCFMNNKKCIHCVLVDVDTAEIYYDKEFDEWLGVSFARQIKKFADMLVRGVNSGKNLSLRLEVYRPQFYQPDMFEPNVFEYPYYKEQIY